MTEAGQAEVPDDPLLRAVAQYWDEILELASAAQGDRLRALVSGVAEPDPAEAMAALADELIDILPGDHPVAALLRAGVMYSSAVQDPPATELAESLVRLSLLVLRADRSAWQACPKDDFDRRVQGRLLSLPAITPDEAGPIASASAHLIRLPRPGLTWQIPAFQFAETGDPWPVVSEVNQLLGAESDPWGVTCWWVDPHARLGAAPAQLLGTGQDSLLRRAALAVGEDF